MPMVVEVKKRIGDLEKSIADSLNSFESETGLLVHYIGLVSEESKVGKKKILIVVKIGS